MGFLHGKRILIVQQRNWGIDIGHLLAKKLAAEGARLAAVTYKKSAHVFHASQKEVSYEVLISNDDALENPEKYLKGRTFTIEEMTKALGVTSIWPIPFASREITRSYAEGFNFANLQQLSDADIILYLQATFAYVSDLLESFKPAAIIVSRIAEPANFMMYYLARKRGIRCLSITDSKVRGVWISTYTPWETEGPSLDRFDELNSGGQSDNAERARRYIAEFRESFKRPTYMDKVYDTPPFWKRMRQELAPYRRIIEWYTRQHPDCIKKLGATVDCRPPLIILRDHYTKWWRKRVARRFSYFPLEAVGTYVYYPLQYEPETTLDVFAPYFTNQIELAKQIAMSLPGDYTLVVKDHPAMFGLRSFSALQSLSRCPNIKLMDSRVSSEKLLKGASLVLAPNSTSLVEAAFYGIPAIQFGDQGVTQKLPNVIRHTDLTTLPNVLAKHILEKQGGDEYERRIENFVASIYDVGHQLDYLAAWEGGKTSEREKIWQMYRKELERIL